MPKKKEKNQTDKDGGEVDLGASPSISKGSANDSAQSKRPHRRNTNACLEHKRKHQRCPPDCEGRLQLPFFQHFYSSTTDQESILPVYVSNRPVLMETATSRVIYPTSNMPVPYHLDYLSSSSQNTVLSTQVSSGSNMLPTLNSMVPIESTSGISPQIPQTTLILPLGQGFRFQNAAPITFTNPGLGSMPISLTTTALDTSRNIQALSPSHQPFMISFSPSPSNISSSSSNPSTTPNTLSLSSLPNSFYSSLNPSHPPNISSSSNPSTTPNTLSLSSSPNSFYSSLNPSHPPSNISSSSNPSFHSSLNPSKPPSKPPSPKSPSSTPPPSKPPSKPSSKPLPSKSPSPTPPPSKSPSSAPLPPISNPNLTDPNQPKPSDPNFTNLLSKFFVFKDQ